MIKYKFLCLGVIKEDLMVHPNPAELYYNLNNVRNLEFGINWFKTIAHQSLKEYIINAYQPSIQSIAWPVKMLFYQLHMKL